MSTPLSAKGTKTLELPFYAFFSYSALQHTIPLTSKLTSSSLTLVNLSHFDSHWILLLQLQDSVSTPLHAVCIPLVFSYLFTLISLLCTLWRSKGKQTLKNMLVYSLLTDTGGHGSGLTLGDQTFVVRTLNQIISRDLRSEQQST